MSHNVKGNGIYSRLSPILCQSFVEICSVVVLLALVIVFFILLTNQSTNHLGTGGKIFSLAEVITPKIL